MCVYVIHVLDGVIRIWTRAQQRIRADGHKVTPRSFQLTLYLAYVRIFLSAAVPHRLPVRARLFQCICFDSVYG